MSQAATKKKKRLGREELTLNLMILPGLIILIIFVFAPLVGSLMAFENYVPAKGLLKSKWVGLSNFEFIFSLPDSKQVFMNTLIIAFSKLVVNIFVPVTFAILLNEIRDDSDIKRRCTMLSLTLFVMGCFGNRCHEYVFIRWTNQCSNQCIWRQSYLFPC